MTPEYAAEQAAAALAKATDSWPPEQAAKHVGIADAWTRLHTALKEPQPVSPEYAAAVGRELNAQAAASLQMDIRVPEDLDAEQFKREMRFALGLCRECGKKTCRCEAVAPDEPEIGVYRERAHLIAHLATQFPAVLAYDDPNEPDWPVIYITTPHGQLSWHIAPDDLDLFGHVKWTGGGTPLWDGHTTAEKYERLHRFVTDRAELDAATPDESRS